MPIYIRIHHGSKEMTDDKPGVFRFVIALDTENGVSLVLNLLYIRFAWFPLQEKSNGKSQNKPEKRKSRNKGIKWNRLKFLFDVAWQTLKKTKLKKLYLDLDTSNVILNANLYPVFAILSRKNGIDLNINYSGNFSLIVDARNNLFTVLTVLVRNILKRVRIIN
jgi:hypothetical protein